MKTMKSSCTMGHKGGRVELYLAFVDVQYSTNHKYSSNVTQNSQASSVCTARSPIWNLKVLHSGYHESGWSERLVCILKGIIKTFLSICMRTLQQSHRAKPNNLGSGVKVEQIWAIQFCGTNFCLLLFGLSLKLQRWGSITSQTSDKSSEAQSSERANSFVRDT